MMCRAWIAAFALALLVPWPSIADEHEDESSPAVESEQATGETGVEERGLKDLGNKVKSKVQEQSEAAKARREERKERRQEFIYDKVLSARESSIVDAVRHMEWDPGCGGETLPFDLARLVRENPGELMRRTVGQALDDVVAGFDELMQTELDRIDEARVSDASAASLAGGGLTKLRKAAAGPTLCLVDFATAKWPDDAERQKVRAQLVERFQAAADALRQKVEPRVRNAIARGLEKLLTGEDDDSDLLTEDELQAVANHVLAAHLVAKLEAAQQQVTQLRNALGGSEAAALGAIRASNVDMTFRENPELADLQRDFAWEVARAMGHKYIDNDKTGRGGYFVNQAVGLIQLSDGTVEKLASALCGLIPEAGAAVCAVVEEGVDIAWNQVLVPAIESAITTFLHGELDRAFDEVRAGRPAPAGFAFLERELATGSAWMGGALIQNVVADHLSDILGALGGYNDSVYDLGQEAANRI